MPRKSKLSWTKSKRQKVLPRESQKKAPESQSERGTGSNTSKHPKLVTTVSKCKLQSLPVQQILRSEKRTQESQSERNKKVKPNGPSTTRKRSNINYKELYNSIAIVNNCLLRYASLENCIGPLKSVHRAIRRKQFRETGRTEISDIALRCYALTLRPKHMNESEYDNAIKQINVITNTVLRYKSLTACLVNLEFIVKGVARNHQKFLEEKFKDETF